MDKVRKFDEELIHLNKNAHIMSKVLAYLFCGLGLMFMLFPAGAAQDAGEVNFLSLLGSIFARGTEGMKTEGFRLVVLYAGFLCGIGEWYYLMMYQRVQEGNQQISIYKKLAYMPVAKAEIRKVRYGYVNRFCARLGITAFILQAAASLLSHSFGLLSVLVVAVWTAEMWLLGRIYLCLY